MKTKILLFLMLMNGLFCVVTNAQNPDPNWADVKYPNLLITECRFNPSQRAYVEITNLEDTAVNLSSMRLVNGYWDSYVNFDPATRYFTKPAWRGEIFLTGTLEPGESFVCAYIYAEPDSMATTITNNNNSAKMISKITWPVFRSSDFGNPNVLTDLNPGLQEFLDDSVFMAQVGTAHYNYMFRTAGQNQILLLYDYDYYVTDSVTALVDTLSNSIAMDVCNVWLNEGSLAVPNVSASVAGIEGATGSHTMIRKTTGFQTADWINESRGISSEDSQWWIVPNAPGNEVYSTVGNYGDYSISFTAKENTTAVVNHNDKTITVPWEALRGEPVTDNYIDFGDGMAWTFVRDTLEGADSAYTRVRDGDLLQVYAFGDDMETETYSFKVLAPTSDIAIARTKIAKAANGGYANNGYFNITEGIPGMDSILNIRYQLRIDTLYKYIETPPEAKVEIVFVDGDDTRIDLMDGDILRVTSQDGTTVKDYYLQVNEYGASRSTTLSAIRWPDYDRDYYFEWEYLRKDTFPDFSPAKKNYTLLLPDDYRTVPAIVATASDLNSRVVINRATSLTGTIEQRTSTITVYSEASDTIFDEYFIVFKLDIKTQLTDAEPFISEILRGRFNADNYIQLYNPNNGVEALDMGHYLLVNAPGSSDEFTAITNFQAPATPTDPDVHRCYVPGYKYAYNTNGSEDPADWTWKDGVVGGITPDPDVNALTVPGDVFIMSAHSRTIGRELVLNQNGDSTDWIVDVNFTDNPNFPNASQGGCVVATDFNKTVRSLFLYKIENDSILSGKKGIWGSPDDYTLVDRVSGMNSGGPNGYGYANGWLFVREPQIQKGALKDTVTFSANPDSCDWLSLGRQRWADPEIKRNGPQMGNYIGQHVMDPITYHLSTVTSDVYFVDLGFEGDLNIVGEVSTQTVAEFLANLNKKDSLQSITVMKGVVAKDSTDMMEDGDVVKVVSADGTNATDYVVADRTLSSNTDLVAVGEMGVVVDNENLTISGFDYTKAVADVLAGVEAVDAKSIINVIDTADNLVSLLTVSKDTSLVEPMVATKVFNGVFFEVVAEDGSVAKYTLVPNALSSDAYVTSNVFTVSQEDNSISGVANGYSVSTFLAYLTPSGNATMKLVNKAGAERTEGQLQFDDKVVVTSEDGTKAAKYVINIYSETNRDVITNIKAPKQPARLLNAYPNPTSSMLYIEDVKVGSVVQVISINGNLVYTSLVNRNNISIDMGTMNNGIYLVRLVEKDKVSVVRVVKN